MSSVDANQRAIEVFYSYAHEDEELRDGLEKQLSNMKRQGLITNWHDRAITGGSCWAEEIDAHLDSAMIILLLISPDFMNSDYCYGVELKRAMERNQAGEIHVVPIILRPTDWQNAPFAKLQAYPTNGRPVTSWRKRDDAFLNIAQELRKLVERLHTHQQGAGAQDVALASAYCQSLYDHWWMLDFKGIMHIDMNRPMSIPLIEVFVSPAVLVGVPEYETVEREESLAQRRESKSGSVDVDPDIGWEDERLPQRERLQKREQRIVLHRESIHTVLEKHQRMILLGDPGSGKSTFLRYLMLRLAQGKEVFSNAFPQLSSSSPAVPLYIPLATYADTWRASSTGERSLLQFLPKYLSENYLDSYAQFLQHELEYGRVFVLLDGLDEIPDASLRIQIVRQVEAFTQTFPKNRFLITSRIVGYREAPLAADYQVYTLADFDNEQIKSFIQQWCPAYERWVKGITDSEQLQHLATSEAEKTFQSIQRKPAVGKLTVNPLLLTIVALIQRQGIELPSHRIELFDLCAMTLIDTWVKAKGFTATSTFSRNNLIKLLCPLAFWMHQHPAISAIPEDELTEQIVNQLLARKITRHEDEAARLAEEFLDIVRGKTGILIERGKKRYGFLHLTFEEYFAARELEIRDDRDDFIKAHLHESRWREVILLTVGSIGTLHSNEKGVTSVVQNAILHAGSRYEEWLHRDLLFAGACLADDAGVSIECEEQILEQILYLYLISPYDSLRTAIDDVINQWSGMYLASKVAKIILCLLQKRGLGTDIPLRGVRVSAPEVMHLARKLEDYCEQKAWKWQHEVMNIFHGMFYISSSLPEKLQQGKQLLLDLLTSESWDIRQVAVAFLAQAGRNDEKVLASLLPLIVDDDSDVQKEVAQALGEIGQGNKQVIAGLLQLMEDSNQSVKQAAMLALGQVGLGDIQVKQKLLQLLNESLWLTKSVAIAALTQHQRSDPEIVNALLKLLWDSDVNVKKAVIAGLGRVRLNAPEVLSILFSLTVHDDRQIRAAAAIVLGEAGQIQPEIIDRLLVHSTDEDWQTRQTIALALGFTDCKEVKVIQALIGLLADTDVEVQQAAVQSLVRVGQGSLLVINALVKLLASPAIILQQEAIRALGKLGQGNQSVVNIMLRLSTDINSLIRRTAVIALGWIGQKDNEVLEALLTTLSDISSDVRRAGANALRRLNIESEQGVDALLKLLIDDDINVRKAAIKALGEVGQDRPAVLTAFLQFLFEEVMDMKEEEQNIKEIVQTIVQLFVQSQQGYTEVISALSIFLAETYQNEKPNWPQMFSKALSQLTDDQLEIFSSLLSTFPSLTENWKVRDDLTESLHDLDITLLERLLGILKALDYHTPEIVTLLLSFLTDQRWQLRLATVQILKQIKAHQPEVIDALLKLCSDTTESVRLAAIELLAVIGIGQGYRNRIDGLIATLSDKDWLIRKAATQALGQLEEISMEVREQLLLRGSDQHDSVQEAAIISLVRLEGDEKHMLELAVDAISSFSFRSYKTMVEQVLPIVLTRLQSMTKSAVYKNFLLSLLNDETIDQDRRSASAIILGYIAKGETDIYIKLLEMLAQVNSSIKPGIIIALGEAEQGHPEVVDALLKLTSETSWRVKQALAQTFAKLHSEQPEVISFLYNLLFDTDADVRQSAVETLGQFGREEPHVIVKLLKLLNDRIPLVRYSATIALGMIGAGQPEVIDGLLKCLFDPDPIVEQAAVTALGQISSGQMHVVEALLRVIVSGYLNLAKQATETLASLPINRVQVSEQIEQLLQYYGPLTREHVEGDGAVNNLLFALQQLVD